MRASKIVRLDNDREITVKEISPRMVLQLFEQMDGKDNKDLLSCLDGLCREGCGLPVKELAGLYGSELEKIWQEFSELNSFFFRIAGLLGLDNVPRQVGETIGETFGSEFAGFMKLATGGRKSTDGPTS